MSGRKRQGTVLIQNEKHTLALGRFWGQSLEAGEYPERGEQVPTTEV